MTTYYTRRRSAAGRNYYTAAAADCEPMRHNGTWLVVVSDGCTSERRLLDDSLERATLTAAARHMREAMLTAMCEAMMASGGASMADVVEAGLAVLSLEPGTD